MFSKIKQKLGFTMSELLLAVAIVGVIAAISIPVFSSMVEKSKEKADIAMMQNVEAQVLAENISNSNETRVYYYDAAKNKLVKEEYFRPNSIVGYGKGTNKNGGAGNFIVGEASDVPITMEWVDPDGTNPAASGEFYTSTVPAAGKILKITYGAEPVAPDVVKYNVVKGANQTCNVKDTLTFTTDIPFSKFVSVKIDGKTVRSVYYTKTEDKTYDCDGEGATVITFDSEYAKNFKGPTETISFIATDAYCKTTFKMFDDAKTPKILVTEVQDEFQGTANRNIEVYFVFDNVSYYKENLDEETTEVSPEYNSNNVLYVYTFNEDGKVIPYFAGDYVSNNRPWANVGCISYDNKPNPYSIKITSDFAEYSPKSTAYWFAKAYYASSITGLENINTTNVSDMSHMFENCSSLIGLDISSLNTSKVTDMSYIFHNCSKLTMLDVSGFDTSKVTNMQSMFAGCSKVSALDVSKFNTSNTTDMSLMFYDCRSVSVLDTSKFDTSKVEMMPCMFDGCRELTAIDVSSFDTSKVKNFGFMFANCIELTEIDLSNFNTNAITDVAYTGVQYQIANNRVFPTGLNGMFFRCFELTDLNISSFRTATVTDMSHMFDHCYVLTNIDVSNFNTSNTTDMSYMFNYCIALTELDLSNFDTTKVTNTKSMFEQCQILTTIYASDWSEQTALAVNNTMFLNCNKLVGAIAYNNTKTGSDMANTVSGYFTAK